MKISTISNEALAVLTAGAYQHGSHIGDGVFLLPEERLERKLYVEVNKVLEAFGGVWNRKAQGHTFKEDPTGKLDDAIATGEFVRLDKNGYFPTPKELADELIGMLEGSEFENLLEPSAGDGALLRAFGRAGLSAAYTVIVEPNEELLLKAQKVAEDYSDCFPEYSPCHYTMEILEQSVQKNFYDAVIMNPPFENGQDAKHILMAMDLLKPGGELVAIAGYGVTFRRDKVYGQLRDVLANADSETIDNEEGAFKSSGTNVRTVRIHYRKLV